MGMYVYRIGIDDSAGFSRNALLTLSKDHEVDLAIIDDSVEAEFLKVVLGNRR